MEKTDKSNPKSFIAVRAYDKKQPNIDGNMMYPSPYRPTLHFTLNHYVNNHMYGNWDNNNQAIIVPFDELINKNKSKFFGGTSSDMFFVGPVDISDCTYVNKNGNGSLKDIVNKTISERGYLVPEAGNWGWFDEKELFSKEGGLVVPHCNTLFERAERDTWDNFRKDGVSKMDTKEYRKAYIEKYKELVEMSLRRILHRSGAEDHQKMKEFYAQFEKPIREWKRYWDKSNGKLNTKINNSNLL